MPRRRSGGEGSIFFWSEKELWVAQITLPNGKRKKKSSRRQSVVREWLVEQRKALRDNLLAPDQRLTVAAYLDRFIADVATPTLRPSTLHSYTYLIRDHVKPDIGHLKLTGLRPDHLQALYARKLEQGLSKRTVGYIHSIIRRALNQAVSWGLIFRNPTDSVTPPRPAISPPETLSPEQAKLFLASIEGHRWYPLYVLALMTGMRKGELLGLQWEDVDLQRGTVSVTHTVQAIGGRTVFGEPKTARGRRTIALPRVAVSVLEEYRQATGNMEGLVFRTSTGRPISQRNLTRHFHASLAAAGLPRMRFHDLRHTAASLLLRENVHPKIVQEMLGHATIHLTLDTYSHLIPDIQAEAAGKMDELFG
jgi:integrase